MSSQEEHDGLLRGYHNVPRDEELKAMSDIELDSLFYSSKDKPVKAAAIEREINRRKFTRDGAPLIINGGVGGVAITGGAGGAHGDGGAVILTAGNGGSVINHHVTPSSSKMKWFEKPLGVVLLGLIVSVLGGGILFYLGWL